MSIGERAGGRPRRRRRDRRQRRDRAAHRDQRPAGRRGRRGRPPARAHRARSPRATCSSRTCRASARRRSRARWRGRWTSSSRASSARPTCCPPTSSGTNVFNQREDRFEFRPGPIFANVVIVDEINRASPKTQSGLLECMQERRVTVDVHTHELARPFLVLATQNPVEYEGTYPLPEAQVDRFMMRLSMGYPSARGEADMLAAARARRPPRRARAGRQRRRRPRRAARGRPRARQRRAAPLRRRAAPAHARRPAARARAPRRARA